MKNVIASSKSRSGAAVIPRPIAKDKLDALFASIGENLRKGLSAEAKRIIDSSLLEFSLSADSTAHLKRLLSFTLETAGRYTESLDAIKPYEDESALAELSLETQVRVTTQLAIAYNNSGDQPKAVTLLKQNRKKAEANELRLQLGPIDIGLARVYRKLDEYPICRGYAEKALDHFRENADWLGMAEAYREIANSYHQEGNSERSIEIFELGIQIIGRNSAPFMLGKLYTDMSGAYWFLRRPHDGIECLKKSIEFFDQTEHALNSVIAYNNLGINLMLIGEWSKAEAMVRRALKIALRENYVHVAGIYDSLGELRLQRHELVEAEEMLEMAVDFAKKHKHRWYTLQAMRNIARLYLAQGNFEKAIAKAQETIAMSAEIGDKHYANMAGLVLAESFLSLSDAEKCESALRTIEDNDPRTDFFVLGNIQRIRGLSALAENDRELAVHHFSRALTIFESAEDLYHTGLVHFLLGTTLDATDKPSGFRGDGVAGKFHDPLSAHAGGDFA